MVDERLRGPAVRDIARDAVRAHVTSVALDFFEKEGFDEVSIDQIASAAGISRRTFHRYFAAKEDVIVGDPARMTQLAREALEACPATQRVWQALHSAFTDMFAPADSDGRQGKRMIRLMTGTAALRARNLEKHLQWADALIPIIEERLEGTDRRLHAETLVHASLACLDVALATWARSDGATIPDVFATVFGVIDYEKQANAITGSAPSTGESS